MTAAPEQWGITQARHVMEDIGHAANSLEDSLEHYRENALGSLINETGLHITFVMNGPTVVLSVPPHGDAKLRHSDTTTSMTALDVTPEQQEALNAYAAAVLPEDWNAPPPSDRASRQWTVLLQANDQELEALAKLPGIEPILVETTEDGRFAHHEAGHSILETVARMMVAAPPLWDELNPGEQRAVVLCAAQSPHWHTGGQIDPDRAAQLMQEIPELARKFQ